MRKVAKAIHEWAAVGTVLGVILVMLGGWTNLSSRVSVNEANIQKVREDTSYTRDRVDDLYVHLIPGGDK